MNNELAASLSQLLHTSILVVDEQLSIQWLNDSAEALLSLSLRRANGIYLSDILVAGDITEDLLRLCMTQKSHWYLADATIVTQQNQWTGCQVSMTYQQFKERSILIIEVMTTPEQQGIRREYQLLDQNTVGLSMVRNLAHEIKNPLSGLRGAAQLLERKLPGDLTRFTEVIVAEADRLQNLVDRMLTPAKVEQPTFINLHQITERAIEFISLQPDSKLSIVRDYDPSLPSSYVATEQIYQALLNLLTNASEALEHEGEITIRSRAVHQHSIGPKQHRLMIKIDVEDNGPGIQDDLKHLIFFPTISGKQSSGLGLGIAQSLIRQNDGIIEYQSVPGKTCFSIFLPIKESNDR